jgi:putative oxidoreductase
MVLMIYGTAQSQSPAHTQSPRAERKSTTLIVNVSEPMTIDMVLLLSHTFLGLMIFTHGFRKVFYGGKLAGTARWLDSVGMRPGTVHAFAAASTELGAGVLLTLGLLTPLASAALLALMLVAIATVHRTNGFMITNPGGGIEYCLCLSFYALTIGTFGAGRFSFDHLWRVFSQWSPTTRFFVTFSLGVGGALLQLAIFYRPSKSGENTRKSLT